jgi:hypothetical protein
MDISFLLMCRAIFVARDFDISALRYRAHEQVDCRMTVSWERCSDRRSLVGEPFQGSSVMRAASEFFPIQGFSARCLWTEWRVVPQIAPSNQHTR